MVKRQTLQVAAAILCACAMLGAADNLKLNPRLDYSSDSQDGPLITGEHMDEGLSPDMPNYVIFFGEGWFNSKRQARRTVELYNEFKGRVRFVIVDLDRSRSAAQQALVKKYYRGYIPHLTVIGRDGKVLYNAAGEVEESLLSVTLKSALKWAAKFRAH